MNYSNMIKTENTNSMYELWKPYRKNMTSYIQEVLASNCKKNSWVAIWGAGGCNDIEISELANNYRLILIDRDIEELKAVRDRYGLSSDICKVVDVGFWNITDEDYEMFQALLMDGASLEDIENFFNDLIKNMLPPIDLNDFSVECSVVVGLTSQLNARFAALLHVHKDKIPHIEMERVLELLNNLNRLATDRLFISLRQITNKIIISGYETCTCYSNEELAITRKQLESCFEEGKEGGSFLSGEEASLIKVAGNEYWHKLLYKGILMDKLEEVGMCQIIDWRFTESKSYPMLMVALIIR